MDKNATVRAYELTYLLAGDMTDSEVTAAKTEIENLLKKHQVSVTKVEDWGRKPMMYVMTHEGKKQRDAYYTHIVFTVSSDKVQQLEQDVYLLPKVMRHLLVVSDGKESTFNAPVES